jgi:hypothetical protein
VVAFFISPFFGLIYGLPLLFAKGEHVMPYGPFLSGASLIALIFRENACQFLEPVEQLAVLHQGEIWLAASVALLVFAAWASRLRSPWALGLVVLLGLAWCGVAVVFRPATLSGYMSVFAFFPALILALAALPLAVWQGWRGFRASPTRPLGAAGVALTIGALYLVPFVLWGYGIIARYDQALGVAMLLVALSWIPVWYVVIRARRGAQRSGD